MKTYTIDAAGKKLGRVASEAAAILIGKNTTTFVRNAAPEVKVVVINASKADISEKKKQEKIHSHYSMYPGGQKNIKLGKTIADKGYGEAFRKAIKGMTPKNKLQNIMMKNLTVTE